MDSMTEEKDVLRSSNGDIFRSGFPGQGIRISQSKIRFRSCRELIRTNMNDEGSSMLRSQIH